MATLPPSVIFGAPPAPATMVVPEAPLRLDTLIDPGSVEWASEWLSSTLMARGDTFLVCRNETDLGQTRLARRKLHRTRCIALGSNAEWIVDPAIVWTLATSTPSLIVGSTWLSRLDRTIRELGRLKAGWDGPGSQPLSHALLVQVESALAVLPPDTLEPELEVDGSDCSVTARWWTSDEESAFAMTFTGNGKVHGVTSSASLPPPPAWHCNATEETKILDQIDHPLIRQALTGYL